MLKKVVGNDGSKILS